MIATQRSDAAMLSLRGARPAVHRDRVRRVAPGVVPGLDVRRGATEPREQVVVGHAPPPGPGHEEALLLQGRARQQRDAACAPGRDGRLRVRRDLDAIADRAVEDPAGARRHARLDLEKQVRPGRSAGPPSRRRGSQGVGYGTWLWLPVGACPFDSRPPPHDPVRAPAGQELLAILGRHLHGDARL